MFFHPNPKPLQAPIQENNARRLQAAQLTLTHLLERERMGHQVVIERTIAEIEVSRLNARRANTPFLGLKMLVIP